VDGYCGLYAIFKEAQVIKKGRSVVKRQRLSVILFVSIGNHPEDLKLCCLTLTSDSPIISAQ
jgi:hypothetical protein